MAGENFTMVSGFILQGFSAHPEMQDAIFGVLLVIYVITLVGNLGMIVLISIDPRLHTPMYFFLCQLSCVEICHSSNIIPKALENLLWGSKYISVAECFIQMYIFTVCSSSECFFLSLMAYDRYIAICNPLLYTVVMSSKQCLKLATALHVTAFIYSILHGAWIRSLSFCHTNVIDHFFCEIPSLLKLSCSNTHRYEVVLLFTAILHIVGSNLIIMGSYAYILSTILRMRSAEGRKKTFSTCASHLTDVIAFYGTGACAYLQSRTENSQEQDKMASMFYTVVTPMLNPLIYSLRNKEVKDALRRVMCRKMFEK
ncbi:olfactory receptor 1052-like [Alligator sinensis]|uniref:Olfactory receptor n=1 Tax=Alligator sinensis TaxID=38654 RepID=A0A3Q0HCC3_ALLSI|nr:olfactory receptor 1052-like [Alligator sinensis]